MVLELVVQTAAKGNLPQWSQRNVIPWKIHSLEAIHFFKVT